MAKIPLGLIQADPKFQQDCAKADAKARRAAQRVLDRIMAAEKKELERHRKRMTELSQQQRNLPRDIYDGIYGPLEEAAYTRAEQRLAALNEKEGGGHADPS